MRSFLRQDDKIGERQILKTATATENYYFFVNYFPLKCFVALNPREGLKWKARRTKVCVFTGCAGDHRSRAEPDKNQPLDEDLERKARPGVYGGARPNFSLIV
jgi:hypothetical protein